MLAFLKNNAMQVAGAAQVLVGIALAFTHLTTMQTAQIATLPTGVATFFSGVVITTRKNGSTAPASGVITVTDPGSGHTLTVDTGARTVLGTTAAPDHSANPPETTP